MADLSFNTYQHAALRTDILPRGDGPDDLLLPLLGLVGEVGELATEWKKRKRDTSGYRAFEESVQEELGDALWYMAALADRVGLNLADIAAANLDKAAGEYLANEPPKPHALYDDDRDPPEQLPRHLDVRFDEHAEDRGGRAVGVVTLTVLDAEHGYRRLGDPLDDNNDIDDFYRYHDAFHLAHMAVLGWSPVIRAILDPKAKRKSDERADRVEDGARAIAIEEGLTAAIFAEAADHSYFATATRVPRDLLKSCMRVTAHLEVNDRSLADWQHAILAGYAAYRFLVANRSGVLVADMHTRTLTPYRVDQFTTTHELGSTSSQI
jgi:NTP pyrophosphatase (non-canonical NTP hydrolase)